MKLGIALSIMAIAALVTGIALTPAAADVAAHNGVAQHVYLFEKAVATDWSIVDGGAWGKMMYQDDKFDFNGHKLAPETTYTLIYYPDPWPGEGLMCFGEGTTDVYGEVNVVGKFDFTGIPIDGDTNLGAKIWLVLSGDITCSTEEASGSMAAWNPAEYLFEYTLINLQ